MKKNMKTLIRNILLAAAVLMTALSLCACGTKTVDLNKYVKIETSGYNGAGTATVRFDEEKFAKDHDKHIKLSKEMSYLAQYANVGPAVGMMKDCVGGRLDRTSGLSNGDKITFSWSCSDAMAKQLYGVNLKYSDITYKVKDLGKVKTFDPFDYITVSFSGYDSYGSADINVDYSNTETQYLRYTTDQSYRLHNGDSVKVKAELNCDPAFFASTFGKTPKSTEKEYKVSGLSKVDTFDPFELVSVTFSGTEPSGEMSFHVDETRPEAQYLRFDADKTRDLSNGEEVTITVSLSGDPEYFISQFGKLPGANEKKLAVNGLNYYVKSVSEIDAASLEAMKRQAEDVFYSHVAQWQDPYHVTSMEYAGTVFRTAKQKPSWSNPYNECSLVYKIGLHVDEHDSWACGHVDSYDETYYFIISYNNIMNDPQQNSIVDVMDYQTKNSISLDNNAAYIDSSYWTAEELVSDCLTKHLAEYYIENNLVL